MSKSDPKHFMTIDGHKFRKNHVRWAREIINVDPNWCPETQSLLAIMLKKEWAHVDDSMLSDAIREAGVEGNAKYFCRPWLSEDSDSQMGYPRKYTKQKNNILLLFKVLKDRRKQEESCIT